VLEAGVAAGIVVRQCCLASDRCREDPKEDAIFALSGAGAVGNMGDLVCRPNVRSSD
jgi:hypothetical protein